MGYLVKPEKLTFTAEMNRKFEINMPKHPENEISSLSLVLQLSGPNLLRIKKASLLVFQLQKTAGHKPGGKKKMSQRKLFQGIVPRITCSQAEPCVPRAVQLLSVTLETTQVATPPAHFPAALSLLSCTLTAAASCPKSKQDRQG